MPDSALQLPDLPPTSAPPDANGWLQPAVTREDLCFILKAPSIRGDAPAWPRFPPPFAALEEDKEFAALFAPRLVAAFQGEEQHVERSFDLPGGAVPFELNLYPAPGPRPATVVVMIRQVSEQRRLERKLQLLLESAHLLSESPDLATATSSILQRFCLLSGWPLGEVWIPTPAGDLDLFSIAHGPETPRLRRFLAAARERTLRLPDHLQAHLWRGLPAFIPDLGVDPVAFRARAAARAGFRSAFLLPLQSGAQTHAVMLFFLADQCPPDPARTRVLGALSAELAAVFQRERTQEQLNSFFNRSLDMHCLAGFDGFLKRVNPAWTRTLGYGQDELLARPLIEFIHPEDRPLLLEQLAVLGHGEDLTGVEVRCLCADGDTKWTLWNATPLASQHLLVATIRDITERKRTEAAVAQSEEHYRDLFHQAYQMQENLRRMSDRMLRIQEHERSRISRDLHDEVGQALTAINMNLAILRNTLVGCAPEIERRISDTQQLIENTMGTIHNFSRELRPAMLDDLGLLPALRNYVKNFSDRTGVRVQLEVAEEDRLEELDSDRKTVIYRIVQEGLNNVIKHAHATRVEIALRGSPQDARLELSDNGRGFTLGARPESAPQQLGLLGLAERVRLVGGEFVVASLPARGTVLRATIPFAFA